MYSNRRICTDYQLDWSRGPFKILGVFFPPDVSNIWDLNTNDILNKVVKILNNWSKRKLTLLGRITIIKSLALSKFVHLLSSLPDPSKELFKELEGRFYNFLWNKGPDRLRRKVMINNVCSGGVENITYTLFCQGFKNFLVKTNIHASRK